MALNTKARTQQRYERSPNGPLQSPGLGALALPKGFYFGSAIDASHFGNLDYMKYVFNEISCATPENSMHPNSMQQGSAGNFNFAQCDQELAVCQGFGIPFRGHYLVNGHTTEPSWLTTAVTSAATATSVLTTQINGIMAHYAGKFKWVNVVNESIAFGGDSNGFQSNVFYQFLGTSPTTGYIALALQLAKAADPSVKVGLNFSGVENSSAPNAEALIRQQVFNYCKQLLAAGIPLDYVGCEMHMGPSQGASWVSTDTIVWLAKMANLGVKLHITEMDRDDLTTGTLSARDAAIATDVNNLVTACLDNPAIEVLQVWELSDRDSWLNRGFGQARSDNLSKRPTLLSWSYGPKTNYNDVRSAVSAQRPPTLPTVDKIVSFGTVPTIVQAPFVITTSKVGVPTFSSQTSAPTGSPGQNMPAGMTVVVNTGKINAAGLLGALGGSLLPAQTNGGTLPWTGPTGITTIWTNDAPNTKDSTGFWAGNWVLPPNGATGLATVFDPTLEGSAEPFRTFINPFSSPGTSELFAGCMITLSSNWNYAGVGEIKIFNPITNAPNNNHILTLTATGPTGVVATGASFPHLFLQGSATGETAGYVPSGGSSAQVPSFVSSGSVYSPSAAAANFYTTIGQPTCLEMYVKSETVAGSSQDGVLKIWVNNALVYATTTGTSFNVCTNGLGWHNFGETNDFGGGQPTQHPPATMLLTRDQYWWATR